jgi:hypothetical protein
VRVCVCACVRVCGYACVVMKCACAHIMPDYAMSCKLVNRYQPMTPEQPRLVRTCNQLKHTQTCQGMSVCTKRKLTLNVSGILGVPVKDSNISNQ